MAKRNAKQGRRPILPRPETSQVCTAKRDVATTWGGRAPTPAGSFDTYRKMRANPTIALARSLATAPIITAGYSLQAADETQDEVTAFVQQQIDALWPTFVKECCAALDFGFQAWELIWESRQGRFVLDRTVALRPDDLEVMVDCYGAVVGIKVDKTEIGTDKLCLFTHDTEPGNPYGRSKHENIRKDAWSPWCDISARLIEYARKVAGVIPMLRYPVGESRDKSGQTVSNFEMAQRILQSLGKGNGVAMPQEFLPIAQDLAAAGIDPSKFASWQIDFLEPTGQHSDGFVAMMKHFESLMLRGWLVPERTATEGQYGTKAEAQAHADIALTMADMIFRDILATANAQLVAPLLRYNYGHEAQRAVTLQPAGLDPQLRVFMRDLLSTVLGNPNNVDLLQAWVDIDALLDAVELPKAAEVIDTPQIGRRPGDDPDDEPTALAAVREMYARAHAAQFAKGHQL